MKKLNQYINERLVISKKLKKYNLNDKVCQSFMELVDLYNFQNYVYQQLHNGVNTEIGFTFTNEFSINWDLMNDFNYRRSIIKDIFQEARKKFNLVGLSISIHPDPTKLEFNIYNKAGRYQYQKLWVGFNERHNDIGIIIYGGFDEEIGVYIVQNLINKFLK